MPDPQTYLCPFCDSEVRVGQSCPGCAKKTKPTPAKHKRSWEQDESYDALDLPDDEFDYEEFVAREFGGKPHKKLGVKWYWWVLGLVLLLVMTITGFLLI